MDCLSVLQTFPDLCQPVVTTDGHKHGVKVVAVFGRDGEEVIVVTADDRVLGFGANRFGRLGLGVSDAIERPQLNATLTAKKIMKICYGLGHCLGLTSGGQCYGWGHNPYGQLGVGHVANVSTPQPIKELDRRSKAKKISFVDICCGDNHSLGLTRKGDVYGWGDNNCGQTGHQSVADVLVPTKVTVNQFHPKINAITCGANHSAALSADGKVYVWGGNECKQLGQLVVCAAVGSPHCSPQLINANNQMIAKRVICGPNHTVLHMEDSNRVVVYGHQNWRPNAKNRHLFKTNDLKIDFKTQFKRMDTIYDNNVVIVTTEEDNHYILGSNDNQMTFIPIESTFCESLFDIFAKFCGFDTSFETIMNKIETIIETKSRSIASIASESLNSLDYDMNSDIMAAEEDDDEVYYSTDEEEICQPYQPLSPLDLHFFDPILQQSSDDNNNEEIVDKRLSESTADSNESKPLNVCTEPLVNISLESECPETTTHQNGCDIGSIESKSDIVDTRDHSIRIFHNHLVDAFNNQLESDIRFKVENQFIYCDKTILKIRNQLFWDICEQNMFNENQININAYSYEAFNALLMYFYGLQPEVNDHNCSQLLKLAKEYGEQHLKDICFRYLLKYC